MYPTNNNIVATKNATPIGIAISCLSTKNRITYTAVKITAITFALAPYVSFSLLSRLAFAKRQNSRNCDVFSCIKQNISSMDCGKIELSRNHLTNHQKGDVTI